MGFLGFPILRVLFVLYVKKVRIMLVTFSLNAGPSEIILIPTNPVDGVQISDFISNLDQ